MTSLSKNEKFHMEALNSRALAFWGNNSVAVYRLIEELNNEAGKWLTSIDENAISEAVLFLKKAQVIMYKRYRDYISEKIDLISADLDLEVSNS